jgi:homoserine kinase type II
MNSNSKGGLMAYTDVTVEEASWLLTAAGVAPLSKIQPLTGGWANSNYLLTLNDGTQLVLKVWDEKSPDEVELVIQHTCWLADHGVPTPAPLLLGENKWMLVKDNLAWMLMPYIDGGWLPSDSSSLYELGKTQAQLHEVPIHESIPTTFAIGYVLWEKLVKDAREKDSMTPFLQMLEKETNLLKERIPMNLPCGIIHGDLYPDNVIGRKGEVLALLDFEEICIESFAMDLVSTYVGFGWKDGLPVPELWDALLAGYQSVRPLTDAEHAALPDLHRYAVLAVSAWRYWQFVVNVPGTEHANRYLEMVDRLDKSLPF